MSKERDAELRREGMADAAVLLVAKRVMPTLNLAEWGYKLELTEMDLQHAVARFKALVPGNRPKPPVKRRTSAAVTADQQIVITALASLGGVVVDQSGRASGILRARTTFNGDGTRFATILKQLEDGGRIRREVRGKRTFRIEFNGVVSIDRAATN